MSAHFPLAVLLLTHTKNTTVLAKRKGTSADCALHPAATNSKRLFFVLFSRTTKDAEVVWRPLGRHPELNCSTASFGGGVRAEQVRSSLGYTAETQRQDVVGFMRAHFAACRARVCGLQGCDMCASRESRWLLPVINPMGMRQGFLAHRPKSAHMHRVCGRGRARGAGGCEGVASCML